MTDTAAAEAPAAPQPKLDELMLAMDVVDTIRHQELVIARELGQDTRDTALKARLRRLYEGQGLTVSEEVLDAGIKALKEARFAYTPPPPSFTRTLAYAWIRRGRVAAVAGAAVVVIALLVGWGVWASGADERQAESNRVAIEETLPRQLAAAAAAARAAAVAPEAQAQVEGIVANGETALAAADIGATQAAIQLLDSARSQLVQSYELRVVTDRNEYKILYRVPDVNTGARNYYVIVEAIADSGTRLSLPITSEETGQTRLVSRWGVRIPLATYNMLDADILNDGIINTYNIVGEKPRGQFDVEYLLPVLPGFITEWEE